MRLRNGTATVAVIVLSVLMLVSVASAAADGYQEGYELGKEEAKEDSPLINIVWGLLGNVFAFGVVAFSNPPDPSAVRLQQIEDQSSDYEAGYLEGYSMSRQEMRLMYVGGGMAIPTGIVLVVLALAVFGAF